jgi:hypothetical protein
MSEMVKRALGAFVVTSVCCLFGATAEAGPITFTGNYAFLTGTGNGPVDGVLSLQQHGNDTFEYGYSGWSADSGVGGTLFGTGTDPKHESWSDSQSQKGTDTTPSGYYARSVGDLASNGLNASNLALVFQVNTTGNNVMQIRKFDVVFIHADGSLVGTLTYTPDNHSLAGTTIAGLDPAVRQTTDNGLLPGVGQGSSGWLYTLNLSSILALDPNFFNNAGNHIGMDVQQFNADTQNNFDPVEDGPDNFWFTSVPSGTPGPTGAPAVPLPSAAWMGFGLLGLLGVARLARSRRIASF